MTDPDSVNAKFRRYFMGGLQPTDGFQGHLRLEPRLRRENDALYCLRFILSPFHSHQAAVRQLADHLNTVSSFWGKAHTIPVLS